MYEYATALNPDMNNELHCPAHGRLSFKSSHRANKIIGGHTGLGTTKSSLVPKAIF